MPTRQLSQEELALIQAKAQIKLLEPRLEMTRECLRTLEDAAATATLSTDSGWAQTLESATTMINAVAKVQLIQLTGALVEGERQLADYKTVIERIESSVRLFAPAAPAGIPGGR